MELIGGAAGCAVAFGFVARGGLPPETIRALLLSAERLAAMRGAALDLLRLCVVLRLSAERFALGVLGVGVDAAGAVVRGFGVARGPRLPTDPVREVGRAAPLRDARGPR